MRVVKVVYATMRALQTKRIFIKKTSFEPVQ
jgi:hypothetical protein